MVLAGETRGSTTTDLLQVGTQVGDLGILVAQLLLNFLAGTLLRCRGQLAGCASRRCRDPCPQYLTTAGRADCRITGGCCRCVKLTQVNARECIIIKEIVLPAHLLGGEGRSLLSRGAAPKSKSFTTSCQGGRDASSRTDAAECHPGGRRPPASRGGGGCTHELLLAPVTNSQSQSRRPIRP
jgi:hypothetical protein